MAANGISTLSTKLARQIAKLELAQAKRKGFDVARDGTISGSEDTTKNYYRPLNNYDLTLLPDTYATDADDNPNIGGLVIGRPWGIAVAEPFGLLTEDSDPITTEASDPLEG
jgi:hypothetical protein